MEAGGNNKIETPSTSAESKEGHDHSRTRDREVSACQKEFAANDKCKEKSHPVEDNWLVQFPIRLQHYLAVCHNFAPSHQIHELCSISLTPLNEMGVIPSKQTNCTHDDVP